MFSKLKEIVNGWSNYIFPSLYPWIEEIAKERATICAECPKAQMGLIPQLLPDQTLTQVEGMVCTGCGCPLSAKCRSVASVCPDGKWQIINIISMKFQQLQVQFEEHKRLVCKTMQEVAFRSADAKSRILQSGTELINSLSLLEQRTYALAGHDKGFAEYDHKKPIYMRGLNSYPGFSQMIVAKTKEFGLMIGFYQELSAKTRMVGDSNKLLVFEDGKLASFVASRVENFQKDLTGLLNPVEKTEEKAPEPEVRARKPKTIEPGTVGTEHAIVVTMEMQSEPETNDPIEDSARLLEHKEEPVIENVTAEKPFDQFTESPVEEPTVEEKNEPETTTEETAAVETGPVDEQ